MLHQQHQLIIPPLMDDAANVRKRVCKACDRCRLKKSKCDGIVPCSRCRADNQVCVFGERKKSHDKVYPKGYVEMLEHQQQQLVQALQGMYQRSLQAMPWDGPRLAENNNGKPLTHDILARLGLLGHDNPIDHFEEDFEVMQQQLISNGAPTVSRHHTPDSDTDREGSQASFYQSHYPPPSKAVPQASYSPTELPTPPVVTPQPTQNMFQHTQKASRPPSLHFQPGYSNFDISTSTAPANSQTAWADTPMTFDPSFISNNFTNFDIQCAQGGLSMADTVMMNAHLQVPEWDDFDAFLDVQTPA